VTLQDISARPWGEGESAAMAEAVPVHDYHSAVAVATTAEAAAESQLGSMTDKILDAVKVGRCCIALGVSGSGKTTVGTRKYSPRHRHTFEPSFHDLKGSSSHIFPATPSTRI